MKKAIFLFLIFSMVFVSIFSQDIQLEEVIENKNSRIMLLPTAYSKQRGQYETTIEMEPFKTRASIGITRRLMIGVSYGGENVIGTEEIDWYPRVEFNLKYKLFDEKSATPAFAIGFSSDGWGSYIDAYERYMIKSRGFYVVASKRLNILGAVKFNAGMNYSVEGDSEDEKNFDIFLSMTKNINEELEIMGEYDLALNDSGDEALGKGRGYLNLGLRWSFAPELVIDFQLVNIFQNFKTNESGISVPEEKNEISRNIAVTYRAFF